MPTQRGIDVSEYQGLIDWQKVRNSGIEFAMIRCGYGRFISQKDSSFDRNYNAAKEAGINVGAYLFSYALNADNAKQEAENCLEIIKGKQFEYPIAYDLEAPGQRNLSRDTIEDIAESFCGELERNGYYVSIYSNLYFLNNKLTEKIRTRYDIWLAQWAPSPTYKGSFGMWQYSSTGNVNGIVGAVDLDLSYKDYPAIMRSNSLNGFSGDASPVPVLYKGKQLLLTGTPIYSSSASARISARVSGTYYVYSDSVINGRIRITNRKSFVGRRPAGLFVSGWISIIDAV